MLLLWLLFPAMVHAQCAPCPTNGIWSEWITVEACKTDCGACSTITYTRSCLSIEKDPTCVCKGDQSVKKPCNTQACNFPRANSPTKPCCDGSTPILFNNWYHCGKLEELNGTTASVCCPEEGIWGEWSGWTKVDKRLEYYRTRTCVSGGFGCKCNGLARETRYDCPCQPLQTLSASACPNFNAQFHARPGGHQYHASECKATVILEGSNFLQDTFLQSGNQQNDQVTYMVFRVQGRACDYSRFQPYKGPTPTRNGQLVAWDFTCNLATGNWNGYNAWPDRNLTNIVAISQVWDWVAPVTP